jgi:hypothetical protein
MIRGHAITVINLVLLVALIAPTEAHAPEFPEGRDSLGNAFEIDDPTKSWAIYSRLHGDGEANYYLLRMKQGENITVSLTAPRSSTERGFLPLVVLMGPGIKDDDAPPTSIQVPDGAGVKVVGGELPSRMEYEPFSPSVFYELGRLSVDAPEDGDYYLAVYDGASGGDYGLAVGLRESFTAEEWLLVPFSAISIYQWEGQSLLAVLSAPVAAFLIGLAIMLAASNRRRSRIDVLWITATMAGLLLIASSVSLAYQMHYALSLAGPDITLVVTAVLVILPLALGMASLKIAYRRRSSRGAGVGTRLALVAIGALGLLLWGGWIAGPAMAIVAAVLPDQILMLGPGPDQNDEAR